MYRFICFLALCLTLSACASTGGAGNLGDMLRQANEEARLRSEVRSYSQFAIAHYASRTDDPVEAANHYASVLRMFPNDPTLAERAIFSALMIGDVDRAVALAGLVSEETLENTELVRLTLALDAVSTGKNKQALEYLQSPWTSIFHRTIAQSITAWVALDETPGTAINIQGIAGQDDTVLSGVALTLAALMKLNIGEVEAASADLEALWQNDARLAIGVQAHARILALSGREDEAKVRIREFREVVGRNPTLTALSRQIDQGVVNPDPQLTTQQGIALAIYAATAALASQGDSDLPSVYFALALDLNPDLDAARTLWADTLDTANRREEAILLLNQVQPSSIYHTNAQGQLAWAYRREGRNDEALAIAQTTLEQTEDRNIRVQLADLLQSLGRDGEAEEVFTQIIKNDELRGIYDWRVYYARGAARERLGEWPLAESDLKTALNLKPNNPTIMNYLGYGWVDRGIRLDDGLRLIENALRLSPRSGPFTDSLGWAHYKLGNYDRAIFYLERATELQPQNPEILDHLGDTYWQTGRYTEAGYQWQRALAYTSDSESSEQIQKKLDGGFALLTASSSRLPDVR